MLQWFLPLALHVCGTEGVLFPSLLAKPLSLADSWQNDTRPLNKWLNQLPRDSPRPNVRLGRITHLTATPGWARLTYFLILIVNTAQRGRRFVSSGKKEAALPIMWLQLYGCMSKLLKQFNENLGRFKACRQWRKMLSWVLLLFINNLIKEHGNQPGSSGFKRGFPSKNSLCFIRVKSTSAFHLPVLYLGLKKTDLPQSTKPKIILVSQGLFAGFPYGQIGLKIL